MKLIVAGGGTGGHLFPGIAVADEVRRRGGEVLFVGTERGLEKRVVPAAGYPLELLPVSGLKRVGLRAKVRGLLRLPGAFLRSWSVLRRFRPDVVLGVGGYASGPLVMTAALLGYATAIQEQNSIPGFTNRILGKVVRAVLVAFEEAGRRFAAERCVLVGNPVRRAFVESAVAAGAAAPGQARSQPHILVVGGSQGARAVNDLVAAALPILKQRGLAPTVLHQTGEADLERTRGLYQSHGVTDGVRVQSFIDDMVSAYREADLVIGRAGALTLAEMAVVGCPALLVPLPTAADDHQTRNARALEALGAARVLIQAETTPTSLADELAALLSDPARLDRMRSSMKAAARPRAAEDIVDRLQSLAGEA